MKKQSKIEECKQIAISRGGEFLSPKFITARHKHNWRCNQNHEFSISLRSVLNGKWCSECENIKEANSLINGLGVCISTSIPNIDSKVEFECKLGHRFTRTLRCTRSILPENFCIICHRINQLNYAQELAEAKGGKCLSTEYINSQIPLEWECSEGHTWYSKIGDQKQGKWCAICSNRVKKTIELCREFAISKGGECLSDIYIGNKYHLEWRCKCGNEWLATWNAVCKTNKPTWCPKCGFKIGQQSRINSGFVFTVNGLDTKQLAKKYKIAYTTLNAYILRRDKQITDESEIEEIAKNIKSSKTDIECIIIKQIGLDKYDKMIDGSKLRYKPDFKLNEKLFINVDGLFWHSEKNERNTYPPKYHYEMRKDYEDEDRRILQFRADEVHNKLHIVESMINNSIGKSIKIYARKCEIKEVNHSQAKDFLIENHMMGSFTAKHIGLFFNDEIVSLISYRSYKDKISVDRFCGKINHSVIGGFGKLMKVLELQTGKLPIHYWVDLRYGTGSFLLNQRFEFVRETLGFSWTDGRSTFNRRRCRANMDERKLTEKEHAEELGLFKIYDAGQRLYIKSESHRNNNQTDLYPTLLTQSHP